MISYYFYCKIHDYRGKDHSTKDAAALEMRNHILNEPPPHDVDIYLMYTEDRHGRPLTRVRKVQVKQ
jgi:hypothetical protein